MSRSDSPVVCTRPSDAAADVLKERLESNERPARRLTSWEVDDTVWGYYVVDGNGDTTEKAYRWKSCSQRDGDFVDDLVAKTENTTEMHDSPAVGAVWAGKVDRHRKEGGDPMTGEPPLRFVELRDVVIVAVSRSP